MNFVLGTQKKYFLYAVIFFEFCPKHPPFPIAQNPKKLFFVCQNIFLQKYPPFLTTLLNPEETAYNFLYVLNNKFSYTQLSFVFLLQKDSYFDYDDSDAFFSFSSERFWYLSQVFFPLFLFFSFHRKILMSFMCLFSKLFFVFFYKIYLPFLYIYTKIKKKNIVFILVFFNFLYQIFFHQNFLH